MKAGVWDGEGVEGRVGSSTELKGFNSTDIHLMYSDRKSMDYF